VNYSISIIWIIPISYTVNGLFKYGGGPDLQVIFDAGQFMVIPVSIITAIRVYGYLLSERSTVFFHALPYSRRKLYAVNGLTGYITIIAPLLLVSLLTIIVCAAEEYNIFLFMLDWFLIISLESLFVYSFTIFMVIILGTKVAAYTITGIMYFFTEIVTLIYNELFCNLHSGVYNVIYAPGGILTFLSPFRLSTMISLDCVGHYQTTFSFNNLVTAIIEQAVVSIILIGVSYYLYTKRKSERSGEFVTFSGLKVLFKWGFAFSFGAFLTIFLGAMVINSYVTNYKAIIQSIVYIFFVILSFITAEMIISKKFNVFKKIRLEIIFVFAVSILVSLALKFDFLGISRTIPRIDEISKMYIQVNFPIDDPENVDANMKIIDYYDLELSNLDDTDNESIKKFVNLNKKIIELNSDIFDSNSDINNQVSISFVYVLDTRESFRRFYHISPELIEPYLYYFKRHSEKYDISVYA